MRINRREEIVFEAKKLGYRKEQYAIQKKLPELKLEIDFCSPFESSAVYYSFEGLSYPEAKMLPPVAEVAGSNRTPPQRNDLFSQREHKEKYCFENQIRAIEYILPNID